MSAARVHDDAGAFPCFDESFAGIATVKLHHGFHAAIVFNSRFAAKGEFAPEFASFEKCGSLCFD